MNISADEVRDALWMCTPLMRYILIVGLVLLLVIPVFNHEVMSAFFSFLPFCKNYCMWQANKIANHKHLLSYIIIMIMIIIIIIIITNIIIIAPLWT